jgi:hypothetical protein
MELSASTDWFCRTDGSDLNGGGHVRGGDVSRVNTGTPLYTGTQGQGGSADNNFVDVNATFTDNVIDANLRISTGTNSLPGVYRVVSRTNSTTLVLNRPCGSAPTSNDLVYRIGGANATPGLVLGSVVAGNGLYIQSGTYDVTSTTPNVANGRLQISVALSFISGYVTTPGDATLNGTRPIIRAAVNSVTLITLSSNFGKVEHLIFDGNKASHTGTAGVSGANQSSWYNCLVRYCAGNGANNSNGNWSFCSFIDNGGVGGVARGFCHCVAKGNGSHGLQVGGGPCGVVKCLGYQNSGAGLNVANDALIDQCVFHGNGGDGIEVSNSVGITVSNTVMSGNVGFGVDDNGSTSNLRLFACAFHSNTAGQTRNALATNLNPVTLTAGPFVDSANDDFSLNSTAGGGADCRAAGFSGLPLPVASTNYCDIGAIQAEPQGNVFVIGD